MTERGSASAPSASGYLHTKTTMAAPSAQLTKTPNDYGSDVDLASVTALSDYGSEIGLDEIDEELILAGVRGTIKRAKEVDGGCVLPSIEFEEGEREDEHEDQHHGDSGCVQIHRPSLLRVAKDKDASARPIASSPPREHEALEVEYDERSRRAWSGTLESRCPSI
jgi:exonuclease V